MKRYIVYATYENEYPNRQTEEDVKALCISSGKHAYDITDVDRDLILGMKVGSTAIILPNFAEFIRNPPQTAVLVDGLCALVVQRCG